MAAACAASEIAAVFFSPPGSRFRLLQNVADDGFHVLIAHSRRRRIQRDEADGFDAAVLQLSITSRNSCALTPASMRRNTCLVWRDTSA